MGSAKKQLRRSQSKSQKALSGRRGAVLEPKSPRLEGEKLKQAVERMQNEPDEKAARRQWEQIERSLFGVNYDD
jgi:hypothetical protein